jgi:hypothetical protein
LQLKSYPIVATESVVAAIVKTQLPLAKMPRLPRIKKTERGAGDFANPALRSEDSASPTG